MWNSAHDTYLESRVLSASPLELIRLLYQGALGAVREARRFLAEGKIAERSRSISKACEIVIELNASLHHEQGSEIATRLAALYDYMLRRLLEANQRQSDEPLADVLGLLSTLSEAWAAAVPLAEPVIAAENPWSVPPETATAVASQAWSL
ncbi:MAG: flagellar export chaperone FliS [Acidobacteriia bacterium]|nr:flagellar export chaperone FliS [Terriglobia bacterium]